MSLDRQIGLCSGTFAWGWRLWLPVFSAVCGCTAPHALLTVEDPAGIAGDAVRLRIGEELGDALVVALEGKSFPVSVVLTSEQSGPRSISIDALTSSGAATGRGRGTIDLRSQRGSATSVSLSEPCEGEDSAGEGIDPRCDDGVFCNGAELCIEGVCRRQEPPCAAFFACVQITCLEEVDQCAVSVDHEICEPQSGLDGPVPTYCDVAAGCVPGDPCDEGADCQDPSFCNGTEQCIGGRCTSGAPPAVDDENPCTIDFCSQSTGRTHLPVDVGTACDLTGELDGLCVEGICSVSVCGDGFRDPAAQEECDWGEDNSDKVPNACRPDCTRPRCGDGVTDDGETCDDGNGLNTDDCLNTCVPNVCGDGIPNIISEECDDGNDVEEDPCRSNCRNNTCGDGFLNPLAEECDDSNRSNLDPCLAYCTLNTCGDGYLNYLFEACDDGNTEGGDGCAADCGKVEICGDAVVDVGEACDDGNTNPVDGCDVCGSTTWSLEIVVGAGRDERRPQQRVMGNCDGLLVATNGDLYLSDQIDHRVLRLDATVDRLVRVAGFGAPRFGGDYGPATGAGLHTPLGLALTAAADIYLADSGNGSVRYIDRGGAIRLYAGQGAQAVPGDGVWRDDVPAVFSPVASPTDVALSNNGELFFSDSYAHCVRRIDRAGLIVTVAGSCSDAGIGGDGGDGGPATAALLNTPWGVAVDDAGDLFIADRDNHRVRKVDFSGGTGLISTVAGTGAPGYTCDDCPAVTSGLDTPFDVATDRAGSLYIADFGNSRVREVDAGGIITTIAGTGAPGFGGDSNQATAALLKLPRSVHVDYQGRVFVGDSGNHRVRMIDTEGIIGTVLGSGAEFFPEVYATDVVPGHWPQGEDLRQPIRVLLDAADNLYVADQTHDRILLRGSDGLVTLFAGTGNPGYNGDDIAAVQAELNRPCGLALDSAGNLFIADRDNHRVRKVDTSGVISTVAGRGGAGFNGDNIAATSAWLNEPTGVAVESGGNLFIADRKNDRVRRVDGSTGIISTVADAATPGLDNPTDVAFDGAGNLYICDFNHNQIRKRTPGGVFSVVAGTGTGSFSGDGGPAVGADINGPFGLVIVGDRLYFADYGNRRVRLVDLSTGIISTVAGNGEIDTLMLHDWVLATSAGITRPGGVAVDSRGNLYIPDSFIDTAIQPAGTPYRVRKVDSNGIISTALGAVEHPGDGPFVIADLGTPAAMIALPDVGGWLITASAEGRVRAVSETQQSIETVAGYPEGFSEAGGPALARGSHLMPGVDGIAYDAASQTVFLSAQQAHVIRRLVLPDPANPGSWVMDTFAGFEGQAWHTDGTTGDARFDGPSGLCFDPGSRTLYVAEVGNHAVRAIAVDTGTVTTFAGVPRERGFNGEDLPASAVLLNAPRAVAQAPDGGLYIADTGNHRVRRVDPAGNVTTVIGDGQPASGGDGSPARYFPVDTPRGLAVDTYGNLLITSGTAVRVVEPGIDGVAGGDDEVFTIYGAEPRDTYPEALTDCLSGILVDGEVVVFADACQGFMLRLTRGRSSP